MPGLIDYGMGSVDYGLDPAATIVRAPSDVGPGQWIEQPQGTGRRYRAALVDPSTGLPLPSGYYESGATPSAIIWEGGSGPVLASPACVWDTTDEDAIVFTISAANLAGLEIQPYPIRLFVGDSGDDPVAVWDGWIDVGEAPASATAIPVYGTYQDILHYCGDRMSQFLTPNQRAGYLVERGEAREWLDSLILAHYRPKYASYYGVGMAYTYGTGSLFPLGIGSLGYPVAQQVPDPVMIAALADDGLVITDSITEAVARYAAALILGRQSDPKWQAAAAIERMRAESKAGSLACQVSTTDDNTANLVVNLSVFDGRDV